MIQPFIQFVRNSKNFEELIKRRPTAFVLLAVIADRARRTDDNNFDDLEIGEALIGDYTTYGVSRQVYRTDILFLTNFKFLTTRTTNRGTVAKLIDKSIFDINSALSGHPSNQQPTIKQPTANHQATTNKNEKNEKNEKKREEQTPAQEIENFSLLVRGEKWEELIARYPRLKTENWSPSLLIAFTDYWLERTPDGKKQKWQLEKTFEVDRRLGTWHKNEKNFNPSSHE